MDAHQQFVFMLQAGLQQNHFIGFFVMDATE